MWRRLGAAALAAALVWCAPRVGYVTSPSMEPLLRVGDGFLTVRWAPEPGSIVVFRPRVLPAEYVVHRVVEVTPAGLLTRGDRSTAMDQASGEPPVTPDRIVGVVVGWRGRPLRIPGLQGTVERVRSAIVGHIPAWLVPWVPVLAATPLLLVGARPTRRDVRVLWRTRVATGLRAVGLAAAAAVVFAHALSSGDQAIEYLVTESPGQVPIHVHVGDEGAIPARLRNPGVLPVTYVVDGVDGIRVVPDFGAVPPQGEAEVTALVPPEGRPGWRKGYVGVSIYPGLLPPGVIRRLHDFHPVAALGACAIVPLVVAELLARWLGPSMPVGRLLGMRRPW